MTEVEDLADEKRRFYIALVPFVIAIPCLILAVVFCFWPHEPRSFSNAIPFGIAGAILVFDLPACIYVLIPWLRTGKPPELSFAPLAPSPEQRRFHRNLRERPKLSDAEFYQTFFADTGIPEQLPIRLRMILEDLLGINLGALRPEDNIACANDDLDFVDVIRRVEDNFEDRYSVRIVENN
ncbi:MAG TPA: hypothetical protein VMJ32_16130 [Pirellulales bacterium]|nr:hypothetical protein [Pirellulales bacterium]